VGAPFSAAGVPFAGPSGRQIERWLRQAGFAAGALRRDVYRLFLALTRLVIDPLLASQAPEAALLDLAAGQTSIAD